jgi:hypothetical protein
MYFRNNNENRISTLSDKYIEELKNYQNECRKYFNLLSEEQIKMAEYNFTRRLFAYYCYLKEYDNAKESLDLLSNQSFDDLTHKDYKKCSDAFLNIINNNCK